MPTKYVPLLHQQRRLHDLPRGPARFEEYLRTALNDDRSDAEFPPLAMVNPMAKEYVAAILDQLLALDADRIAADALAEAERRTSFGDYQACLIVADDLGGGWTNRFACEYFLRTLDPRDKRHWIFGVLWSSEPANKQRVREAILTAAYRTAYILEHGAAKNLGGLLKQEGCVLKQAGCAEPTLDDEELEYTRHILGPLLESNDKRIAMECLFGDEAGRSLGFTPRGLSPWAGIAFSLHDARQPA